MKRLAKKFAITTLISALAFNVFAQSSATATASATIIEPLILSHRGTDMNFGNISVQSTSGGTVVLSPSGTRTTGGAGGVSLPTSVGSVSAAVFSVSGQAHYTYTVILPTSCTLTHTNNNDFMTVDTFTSSPSTEAGAGILNESGVQNLNVGATLNVDANQTAGVYSSGTAFTVTVNYN